MKGKKTVASDEIKTFFSKIAGRYDITNSIMSFGMHKLWNRKLIKLVQKEAPVNATYADLCSGTGAIALGYLQRAKKKNKEPKKLHFLDFCEEMLAIAKKNAPSTESELQFLVADAKAVPLPSQSCDVITMAYGIRNIDDPDMAIGEMSRLLKPGGVAGILELTRPRFTLLRFFHRIWLSFGLPWIGKVVTGEKSAYRHLKDSIETFQDPSSLLEMGKKHGLKPEACHSLSGGIASLLIFKKPPRVHHPAEIS